MLHELFRVLDKELEIARNVAVLAHITTAKLTVPRRFAIILKQFLLHELFRVLDLLERTAAIEFGLFLVAIIPVFLHILRRVVDKHRDERLDVDHQSATRYDPQQKLERKPKHS